MQSNKSKIILAVMAVAIIVGGLVYYWQSSKESEVVNLDKNSTSLKVIKNGGSFSYDSGSMARDCKYLEGEIINGTYKGKKIVTIFFDYKGKLPIEYGIMNIFVTESKLAFKSQLLNYDEAYMKDTDYCLGLEGSERLDKRKNEWANTIEKQKLFSFVLSGINN